MTRTAFYPGSFDPLTNGHLDILRQSAALADKIIIGIGIHPGKQPMFSFQERASLIREAVVETEILDTNKIDVVSFDNLVVRAAKDHKATILIRGLRDGTDLDYEMQMSGMNGTMEPAVTTVFLPASPNVRPITATLVRQIAKMGGDVSPFVPPCVAKVLAEKFPNKPV